TLRRKIYQVLAKLIIC
ncbi:Transferrin-binding protein 2 precursor, partial [Haemophilus influenzae]